MRPETTRRHNDLAVWCRLSSRQRRQSAWIRRRAAWRRQALAALLSGAALPGGLAEAVDLPTKAKRAATDRVIGRAPWNATPWGSPWPAPRPREALARLLVGDA
jgi:hypothetical protein